MKSVRYSKGDENFVFLHSKDAYYLCSYIYIFLFLFLFFGKVKGKSYIPGLRPTCMKTRGKQAPLMGAPGILGSAHGLIGGADGD